MKLRSGGLGAIMLVLASVAGAATVPQGGPAAKNSQDTTHTVVANRVAAMVGKTAITDAMIDDKLYSGYDPTTMTPEIRKATRRSLLDTLIATELLYQEALKDTTIKVTDQEVSESVDEQMKQHHMQLAKPGEFEAALRKAGYKSPDEFRTKSIEDTRRQFYIERYSATLKDKGLIKSLNPMEREVRAFYDNEVKEGRMETIPPSVTFKQIVVAPKASPEAVAKARHLADSLVVALRAGADFERVARKFSMDPGTKDRGGEMPWHRRGSGGADAWDRTFEDAAFSLKVGQISEPVLSPFGFHIIQVLRVQPNEAHVAHILIIPDVDSASVAAAHSQAELIRTAVQKGASFDSIQRLVHDPLEARATEGPYPIDSLPAAYQVLHGVEVGQLSPVIVLESPAGPLHNKSAIVMVTGKFPKGPLPYEVAREGIKSMLAVQYGQDAYIKELRRQYYVDIREP